MQSPCPRPGKMMPLLKAEVRVLLEFVSFPHPHPFYACLFIAKLHLHIFEVLQQLLRATSKVIFRWLPFNSMQQKCQTNVNLVCVYNGFFPFFFLSFFGLAPEYGTQAKTLNLRSFFFHPVIE